MTFPTHPDQLTNAWLSDKLGYTVTDHRVELFGEGAGIIGMVTRVHLTAASGPATIIAKFPSPAPENRAVAATYDMYGRETKFYNQIAPHIKLRVPTCYYATHEPADQSFVILMEDLTGWEIGDQVKGCTAAEAAAVVEGIAQLHASGWQTEADLISHNNAAQREGMMAGFGIGWPVVCEQFPELVPEPLKDLDQRVPARVPELLDTMCTPPICITHADVRLDNVFFKDGQIALVDWQSVCTSAPEQDLAYFVTQSLSSEVRNSRDWVAHYHTTLGDLGVDYSLDTCRERYRVSAAYLLCYAVVIAGTLDMGNERGRQLGKTLFGNAMAALQEVDAFALFTG